MGPVVEKIFRSFTEVKVLIPHCIHQENVLEVLKAVKCPLYLLDYSIFSH